MGAIDKIKIFIRDHGHPVVVSALKNGVYMGHGLRRKQIDRIRSMANSKPLILAVETVNICNAQCSFCAYPVMRREKEVMPMDVFEGVVQEYSSMGGGAVSLTPVMGDLLADPDLIARYKVLEKFKNIDQISFTTNGIAFKRFSDDELKYILERSFLIQLSIGGLDKQAYKDLYRVDRFEDVMSSVERVLRVKEKTKGWANIVLAFRSNNPDFEDDHAVQLDRFKKRGAMISHISVYNNYGGMVESRELKFKKAWGASRKLVCALPLIGPHVLSNGKVTNCGCVDANGDGLIIGDICKEGLVESWRGKRRENLLNSFLQEKCPKLCQGCNAYRPFLYLGSGAFRKIGPQRRLPMEFYLNFYGG
jgi:sulfatase maturation enzyme AslB (radical SAM superfamily)